MGLIRILLALSVVIAHFGPIAGTNMLGGRMAVQAFYIISGFYMSLVLNEKYIGKSNSYFLFISNRLLRLIPIYWVVLLLTTGFSLFMAYKSHGEYWSNLEPYVRYKMGIGSWVFLIFTNIWLLFQDTVMFLGLDTHTGGLFFTADFWKTQPYLYKFLIIPQAWTIGVEIAFYLVAPFIVRRKLPFIFLLILISLSIRLLLVRNGLGNDPWNYRFFPNELVFFLMGNLSYHLYKRIEQVSVKPVLPISLSVMILLFSIFYDRVSLPFQMYLYFIVFFVSLPFIFKYCKHSRLDFAIGDLSYPLYICHMFVGLFLTRLGFMTRWLGPGLTVAVVSLCLAFVLNKLVSAPIERIRQRRVNKMKVALS